MKSSWITALTIVGVLGTSSAAMAINADTLKGIDGGTIGNAIEVLVPVVSETDESRPHITTTPPLPLPISVPDTLGGQEGGAKTVAPAPTAPAAALPSPSESAGSSGSNMTTDDSQVENQDAEDSADDSEDHNSPEDDD